MKSDVFIRSINNDDLIDCVRNCFDQFGGVESICKGNVFIKFNGTGPDPDIVTNREVILSTVKLIKEVINPENIYVMENSAVGFCTRLVYEIDNLGKKIEDLGAIPLYLDEQDSIDVNFNGVAFDRPIPVPKILYENLIEHRNENTYINIPKLKSHIMCGVTICIKNSHGLVYDAEKIYNHHLINEKIVEITSIFKPDFNIVDATTVLNYGPGPIIDDSFIIPMGILFCGKDPVAVDTVGSKLIGIDDAIHINMAAEKGLGTNNFNEINVIPSKEIIDKYKIQLGHDLSKIPLTPHESIKLFKGKERACKTGCGAFMSAAYVREKTLKFEPYAIIFGKGHNTTEIDKHPGPFIVAGPCAVTELKEYFKERKKKERVKLFYINEHVDLAQFFKYTIKAGKIKLDDMTADLPFTTERWMELMKISYQNGGNFITMT
ncbi:MAG: DUF362 domain-containing protein [Candidatus Hermodarchaeota archaeon]